MAKSDVVVSNVLADLFKRCINANFNKRVLVKDCIDKNCKTYIGQYSESDAKIFSDKILRELYTLNKNRTMDSRIKQFIQNVYNNCYVDVHLKQYLKEGERLLFV